MLLKSAKYIIFLLAFEIFISNKIAAQSYIHGTVTDSATNQPVGFASVSFIGTNRGTITNELGEFVLKTDTFPRQIGISCVGYKPVIVTVNSEKINIPLSAVSVVLKDVVIKAGEAEGLFLKVYGTLQKEASKFIGAKTFFRITTKTDDDYTELIECFYKSYLNNAGMQSWQYEQGRFALLNDKNKSMLHSINFSLFLRQFNLFNSQTINKNLPDFPFYKKAVSKYHFTIGTRYNFGNKEIIPLHFSRINNSNGYYYNGVLHVESDTYRLIRVEAFARGLKTPPITSVADSAKIDNFEMMLDVKFKMFDGFSVPSFMQYSIKYDYTPANTNEKKWIYTKCRLMFYDYDATLTKASKIPEDDYDDDYAAIEQTLYLPWFWENNKVLSETPVEEKVRKSFEQQQSFGRTFNSKNDTALLLDNGFYIRDKNNLISLDDIKRKEYYSEIGKYPHNSLLMKLWNMGTGKEDTVFGLCTDLYMVCNCLNDTFYYIALPLFDLEASFITDAQRKRGDMDKMLVLYNDLLEYYVREMKKFVATKQNPCAYKQTIREKSKELRETFLIEGKQMMQEILQDQDIVKWQMKIANRLSRLAKYQ